MTESLSPSAGSGRFGPDGSIEAGALNLKDALTLSCARKSISLCDHTVAFDAIEAVYDPGREALDRWLPEGSEFHKWKRLRIIFTPDGTFPREVNMRVRRMRIPRGDGSYWFHDVLPPEVHPELRITKRLELFILRQLGRMPIRAIRRETLAPRKAIEAIATFLPALQREAMRRDGVRPSYLAFDTLNAPRSVGGDRPLLHITASDPAWGLHWSYDLIDWELGEEGVVEAIVEALEELPCLEAVLATVTDYGDDERRVVAKAVKRLRARRPDFNPLPVLDRFHMQQCFRKAMGRFRVKCWKQFAYGKSGKKLKNVSAADRQKIAAIKSAAYALEKVREGDLDRKVAAARRLQDAFAAAPELEPAWKLLEGVRQVFDCRRLDEAEARYAAWCQALEASGLDCFAGQVKNLDKEWAKVRRYFQVLELFDRSSNQELKIGSNVCERLNRDIKDIWEDCKAMPTALLRQRLLARCGYLVLAARRARPSESPRGRSKKD